MKYNKSVLSVMLSAVLTVGCSSASNPASNTDNAQEQGTPVSVEVDIIATPAEENTEPDSSAAQSAIEFGSQLFIAESQGISGPVQSATARFYRLINPLDLEPELRTLTSLDSCEVGSEQSQINAEFFDFPIDHIINAADQTPIQISSVSAGQSVELSSDAGSYLSLTSDSLESSEVEYAADADMTTVVPNELTANVAGDAFPVFEWQWVKPQVLDSDLKAAVRSIQTNPVISWDAASQSESTMSRIQLYAGYINEVTGEFLSFQCELRDDGSFTMPDDVQALYSDGFVANFVDVSRYTRSVQTIDDIIVVNVFMQKQ